MRTTHPIRGACVALLFLAGVVPAADTNALPAIPRESPIAYFRQLLVMTDAERSSELAGRPEAQRVGLQAKVDEYLALPASERELRLRATELRFYLLPLMRVSPEEREARLESVPENIRDLVADRLVQWALIPPTFRQQWLENEAALQLFSRMHPGSAANADELVGQLPTARVATMERDFARWQALSDGERAQLLRGFNHFFRLTAVEKKRTLRTLSEEERIAMQKALRKFDALPPSQREACVRGFHQFVLMPPSERARFMGNVDRWQAMSPEDREQWRSVVNQLAYQLAQRPPLPPGVEPVLVYDTPPLPIGFAPPAIVGTN
jgi:hypothetical protein